MVEILKSFFVGFGDFERRSVTYPGELLVSLVSFVETCGIDLTSVTCFSLGDGWNKYCHSSTAMRARLEQALNILFPPWRCGFQSVAKGGGP